MKLTVEPQLLHKFLSAALIDGMKGGYDAQLINFSKEKILFEDLSLGTIAVYGLYSPKYFLEYEADNEQVAVTKSLLDIVKKVKAEKVTLYNDLEKLKLKFNSKDWEEPLRVARNTKWNFEVAMTPQGVLPAKLNNKVCVNVDVSELRLPVDSEFYTFQVQDNQLYLSGETADGKFRSRLNLIKAEKLEQVKLILPGDEYNGVLDNLEGSIWLNLTDNYGVFSSKQDKYALTYIIAGRIE